MTVDCHMEDNFSHIYVEKKARDYPLTGEILAKLTSRKVVEIDHYKDVFNRRHQNSALQRRSKKLILAVKEGELIYPGAPVCQNFDRENFFYTSCVMNCIFDCQYCYLKGMYPSANLVVFVNLRDIFAEVKRRGPMYLCVSYDTDLCAVEGLTGFVRAWAAFTRENPELTIEVRTKAAPLALIRSLPVCRRMIMAYTLSPEAVRKAYEPGTGSLDCRLEAAALSMDRGMPVRLCFDPMLYVDGWKEQYAELIRYAAEKVDFNRVLDFSVGTFRVSAEYVRQMRRQYPRSALLAYPFCRSGGYCQYPEKLMEQMEAFASDRIREYCPRADIFRWKKEE